MNKLINHALTPGSRVAVQALADAIRRARRARDMSQADLAERARVSLTTMVRMEKGHPGIALWAWLGVMDVLGLLDVFRQMRDPVAEAMARGEGKRVRKATSKNELDF